ncbi:hypothetical protein RHSIM_Rhsim10G0098100 [Rhododendron simsii]|uniref:SWIM-type domain-containing protein n=1 Tax=Rhododendron simsii TaxID=118357 RepID=A0A834GB64_RHOSS|nr:hypothetical protein RHSIM_Rhsim10G0098100 [Rhododendron simsii]
MRNKDKKALLQIYQAINGSSFEKISSATTSTEAWAILRNANRGIDKTIRIRLQVLRGEFEYLQMKDDETIAEYFTRTMVIVNQIRRIDKYFVENDFEKCPYEHALYMKVDANGNFLLVCLYVDDLIFTGNALNMFKEFKKSMIQEFEMIDIGFMSHFLGIEVEQREDGIFILHFGYAQEVLKRFVMESCNLVNTPVEIGLELRKSTSGGNVDPTYFISLVGSLRYLICTRPDILYGVGLISRYMEVPAHSHLNAAKRILCYIKGFSVRVHSCKTNTDGQTTRKQFVCFKQGKKQPITIGPIKRKRGIIREDCPAKVTVVRRGEGFEVSQFVEGHNHPLTTPKKVHLLHFNRKVTPKCLVQQLRDANVPPFQQMSILELQSGGLENVGFKKKDLYNDKREKNKLVDGHDRNMMYEYLQSEKEKNPGFAFTFKAEDKQRITHCFWADATCRKSYKYFGDVRAKIEGSRFCEILVNKSSNHVSCSCKMFEFEGIPCWHMLGYFARMQIITLSDQNILWRWTVAAKTSRVLDDLGGERGIEICGNSMLMRRQHVFQLFSNVVDDTLLTEDGTQVLEEALESVRKRVALMKFFCKGGEGSGIHVPISLGSQLSYKEPLPVKAKGYGKRLKGGKEKAVKALRKCNGCGLTGQLHDKRNYPKLLNMYVHVSKSSQYTRLNDEDDTDNEDGKMTREKKGRAEMEMDK